MELIAVKKSNIILIKNTEWFLVGSIFRSINVGIVQKFFSFSFIIYHVVTLFKRYFIACYYYLLKKVLSLKGLIAQKFLLVIIPCLVILLKCSLNIFFLS